MVEAAWVSPATVAEPSLSIEAFTRPVESSHCWMLAVWLAASLTIRPTVVADADWTSNWAAGLA